MSVSKQIEVSHDNNGARLDKIIIQYMDGVSRSALKNQLQSVAINGKSCKLSHLCREGDIIEVTIDDPYIPDVTGEDIPLDILFEDDNYIIINKAAGMVVHPAKGNYSGTLVNALMGMNMKLSNLQDKYRPGIVHRLDKDTAGVIVIAKNNSSHAWLGQQFQDRTVKKIYHAWVKGFVTPNAFTCDGPIGRHPTNRKKMAVVKQGGKVAVSRVEVQRHLGNFTYVEVSPETGRTHQIRVHLAHAGFPIVGDPLYARRDSRFPDQVLCLAAVSISFHDTFSGKEITVCIDDPEHMNNFQNKLETIEKY
jgi:23S rRNA pseudouridine1911/1915/1917 synthase